MRPTLLVVAAIALMGCAGASSSPSASVTTTAGPSASPSQSPTAGVRTAEQAKVAATRLTTIAGPWTIDEVAHGTYGQLWRGATNDLSDQGIADRARKAPMVVWRVDLFGPNGREELYIDEATGWPIDWIIQGS